jgi:hypothetical protein
MRTLLFVAMLTGLAGTAGAAMNRVYLLGARVDRVSGPSVVPAHYVRVGVHV